MSMSMNATILDVHARRVWDSRGRPTVETEVLTDRGHGRAIAPAGESTGSQEALDLRDGGSRLGGMDVGRAVDTVNQIIAPALCGLPVGDQSVIDDILIGLDPSPRKTTLGGNSTISTSMAVAWAAAAADDQPLWARLASGTRVSIPLPQVQIVGGGAHAGGALDLQDIMVVPFGAVSFAQAIEWAAEIYLAFGSSQRASTGRRAGVADEGGYWPEFTTNEAAIMAVTNAITRAGFTTDQVGVALDVAASEFEDQPGRYRLALEHRALACDDLLDLLLGWIRDYPIVSIEDPVSEHDTDAMIAFTSAAAATTQVVGDDFLVTNAERVRHAAMTGACTAVLVKPNQAGTLTEAWQATRIAREHGLATIVSARSGESEDVTIAHLAVGWDSRQIKVGSITRGERTAKWNELIRIEEALGGDADFAGRRGLAPLRHTATAAVAKPDRRLNR